MRCVLTYPSGHFSGDYISALRGCCALKFLYALEIDQCYVAHTPTGTGVPQNFSRENVKFGLKFSVCTSITSELMANGDIIINFYPHDVSRARGDNMGTISGWACPLKFWRAKKRPKLGAISDNFLL